MMVMYLEKETTGQGQMVQQINPVTIFGGMLQKIQFQMMSTRPMLFQPELYLKENC